MKVRIKELETVTKKHELAKSGLEGHAWTEHRRIEVQIIHEEDHWYKRKFKEAVCIIFICNIINEPSVHLRNLLKPYI